MTKMQILYSIGHSKCTSHYIETDKQEILRVGYTVHFFDLSTVLKIVKNMYFTRHLNDMSPRTKSIQQATPGEWSQNSQVRVEIAELHLWQVPVNSKFVYYVGQRLCNRGIADTRN